MALVRDGDAAGKVKAAEALEIIANGSNACCKAIVAAGCVAPLVVLVRD